MEKIFRNCSRWIKLFAKIGFAVYAVYGTYLFFANIRYSFFEGFIEFNLNVFKGFALLFVMYGFAKIVEHFEKKDQAAAPVFAEESAAEVKAEPAAAPAAAAEPWPEAKAEPAPAPSPAQRPVQEVKAEPATAPAPAPVEKPVQEIKVEPAPAPAPAKKVKYCPKCGRESDINAHFCDKCGTAL